jgi:hypothetical protein
MKIVGQANRKSMVRYLALGLIGAVGVAIYLGVECQSLEERINQMQLEASRAQSIAASKQDSAVGFGVNYETYLTNLRNAIDAYEKDGSEINRHQIQQTVGQFAEFIHDWQQLISAMAVIINQTTPEIARAGQVSNPAQAEKLLTDLKQAQESGDPNIKLSIARIKSFPPPN